MLVKPSACDKCPLHLVSFGFVFDQHVPGAKVAIIHDMPGKETLTNREAGTSGQERAWFHSLFEPHGLESKDLAWCYLLRCGMNEFPTGWKATQALAVCRQYDGMAARGDRVFAGGPFNRETQLPATMSFVRHEKVGVAAFPATMFLVTESFRYIRSNPAVTRVIEAHCRRAAEFALEGEKVLLLAGREAMESYAPHLLEGGARKWMGHFESYDGKRGV